MIRGRLFSRYYLHEGVREHPAWSAMPDRQVDAFAAAARVYFENAPEDAQLGEPVTEHLIIFPVLHELGWSYLPQQKAGRRREDVPDALLFLDPAAQKQALKMPAGTDRWKLAAVVNENKAWDLPLDRASGPSHRTPASQVLRYLRLGDEQTIGLLRWALLSNGRIWRLYYAGASSVADRFLEVDLKALLDDADTEQGRARLKTFMLFFRRSAFEPDAQCRSFLLHAMDEGRAWQERVTAALSRSVLDTVYPALLSALGAADPARKPADPAWPEAIRHSAVILLYRLLFLLYAEDRDLLPGTHPGYRPRSLRHLRNEIAQAVDDKRPLSPTDAFWWATLATLFKAIDKGSDAMGLPAYNGGLFDAGEAPLLQAVELPDSALAQIIDGLSRRQDGAETRSINYRDLSVQQLGAIYERLLEFDVAVDQAGRVTVSADSKARKLSGSFYTPTSLVRLILDATVGPHVAQRRAEFHARALGLHGDRRPIADRIADLRRTDPAVALLELKVADAAMGSGHFLVAVVDRIADAVLLSMEEAAVMAELDGGIAGYTSPLVERIEAERAKIEAAAKHHKWLFRPEQLDDRHIVRRLVLKRCVYGVDRNPLVVELAKLSLWLHSFTVGAPLSFLDHHLRCGDSLFGAWVADTESITSGKGKPRAGGVTVHQAIANARGAAAGMARIEALSDADLSQVNESKQTFDIVEEATAPLRAFLDCWHALLWLPPLKGGAKRERERAVNAWLDGLCGDPVALAQGVPPTGIPVSARVVGALITELRAIARRQHLLHWQPAFPGVWSEWEGMDARGGFDAVVGNPPWVRQESLGAIKSILKQRFRVYAGTADLSSFFLEQAVRLTRPGGRVGLVLPNKFFKADYGESLREFLQTETWIERVIDFGHNRDLFLDADVFPCVLEVRRPTPREDAPEDATVAVIPSETAQQDRLPATVAEMQFPMPLRSFDKAGWIIEPAPVRALIDRLRSCNPTLAQYAGVRPYRGVLTGCNDAFVVDTAMRDKLVASDPNCAALIKPFVRGQDIERWAADWSGCWMIFTRHGTDINQYPALKAHLTKFRKQLDPKPSDWKGDEWEGRKSGTYQWWEIQDSVAYFADFARPKIIYQEIQFYPAYAIDSTKLFFNNTGFMIENDDPFLVSALNSPLMWWFSWRHLQHGKDEALRPWGFKMELLPIARPNQQQAARAAEIAARLAEIHHERHAAMHALADWLRVEWGVAKPNGIFAAPFALSADQFADELRKTLPKGRKLSVADVAAVKAEHAQTVAPVATSLQEAVRLERKLSAVVNAAYGLTPEEEALVWRTAPPRMPTEPPDTGEQSPQAA